MNYLVINHVPFVVGSSRARFRVPDRHLDDLRAHAAALAGVGGRLMVAAPLTGKPAGGRVTGFGMTEIRPDDLGLEFCPLPGYRSFREYLRVREALEKALRQRISAADVVQCDYGGYPVVLAESAWDIAGELGRPRIFVFDASDPFPAGGSVGATSNPVRRAARSRLLARRVEFCRRAVAEADAVLAHNATVAHRFRDAWDEPRCREIIPAPMFGDDALVGPTELETLQRRRSDRRVTLRLLCFGASGDHALRALAHCRRLSVPVSLSIVADDPALREMSGGLAMSEHVTFVDPALAAPALRRLMLEHDVLLVAPANDPPQGDFDRNLLLAMANGMAVISYEHPSTARVLETHLAATVTPTGNVLLLAQAIIDQQQNRRRLITLCESGWRFAASRTLQAVHRLRAELARGLLTAAGA